MTQFAFGTSPVGNLFRPTDHVRCADPDSGPTTKQYCLARREKNDASQACVPGFSNVTRTLSLSSAYLDPATGSQPVLVNGTPVTGSPRDHASGSQTTTLTSISEVGVFRLRATPLANAYFGETVSGGESGLDASGRLTSSGGARLTRGGVDDGEGSQSYRWSDETLQYTPAILPLADDRPFMAAIAGSFSAATLTDSDGACFGDGNGCSAYHYDFANSPGSEIRLGRLRLGNAHGSEFQSLDLPLSIETWQNAAGGSFRVEGLDTCTTATVLQAPGLTSYTGQLSQENYANDQITLIAPSAGLGLLRLQPPGVNGSVLGQLPAMPSWLFYEWNGQGREAATGLARFGIYRGSPSMIFQREVYR